MINVYLAGGHRTNWRETFTESSLIPFVRFYDPSKHGLVAADQYTHWDLAALNNSEVVIAYIEKDNPSGIGLALEVGYAKAIMRHIIFIDGQPDNPYFGMVRTVSDVVVAAPEEAVAYLRAFVGIRNSILLK